ncbi:MAG: GGDEF domain-containing protein [Erysipelotrichaceae bacterium]|nr:GGDEF domain-containing protein [Erysipelotrichaceae bacterium]
MTSEILLQIFPVFCIVVGMSVVLIQEFRTRRFMSVCFFLILLMTVALTIFVELERVAKEVWLNIPIATVSCFLGYVIRPVCLYMFILLARRQLGKIEKFALILLGFNFLVYATSLVFPVTWMRDFTFHYEVNAAGTALVHVRGPMNFTAHVIASIFLLYLIYITVAKLRGKHRSDAYPIIICAIFIIAAVIVEMMNVAIGILNIAIAASCVFYYLFLIKEENRRDALTGLFDRKTYYSDIERFSRSVSGVIQIDMNGLKTINDTEGHQMGDHAIWTVAKTIEAKTQNNMYVYRVGGDEFTVIVVGAKLPLEVTVTGIRDALEATGYSCAIGYATCENGVCTVETAAKNADHAMYEDKAKFYIDHPEKNRRQR